MHKCTEVRRVFSQNYYILVCLYKHLYTFIEPKYMFTYINVYNNMYTEVYIYACQ